MFMSAVMVMLEPAFVYESWDEWVRIMPGACYDIVMGLPG
jgi:hypothetical protein